MGVYAFVASAGGAVGLLAGGVLTETISWHWIFYLNIPIGILTGALAVRVIRRDRGIGLRAGADVPGAVPITASTMLGVYTIVQPAAQDGWLSGRTLGLGVISLGLLGAFVVRQLAARNPLMPLRIFRSREIAGANLVQVLGMAGMVGMLFLGSLYLRLVLGYSPMRIGIAFLPVTLLMAAMSLRYSSRLITRLGARATMLGGLVLIAAGLLAFTQVPAGVGYLTHLLPVMILLGTGAGGVLPRPDDPRHVRRGPATPASPPG